jgi:membrane-bound ClpP family serine protease
VVTALAPSGTVRVGGEMWSAVSDDSKPIAEGVAVVVREVNGVTLTVSKAQGNDKEEVQR